MAWDKARQAVADAEWSVAGFQKADALATVALAGITLATPQPAALKTAGRCQMKWSTAR